MKDKNPIDHVRFYRKNDPTTAIIVKKEQVFYQKHFGVRCPWNEKKRHCGELTIIMLNNTLYSYVILFLA